MGRAGRVACIGLPYLLTIGSLVALIFAGIGSTDEDSSTLNKIYFMRVSLAPRGPAAQVKVCLPKLQADLSNVTAAEASNFGDRLLNLTSNAMNNATEELAAAIEEAEKASELRDFYDIGLFGYCEGEKHGKTFDVDFCSKPKGSFWFNPLVVWHLNVSGVHDLFPSHLESNLQTYQKVSHWMFVAYVLAFATLVVQLLVGISAIFSRIGSIFTTIVSAVCPASSCSNGHLITNVYISGRDRLPHRCKHHVNSPLCYACWRLQLVAERIWRTVQLGRQRFWRVVARSCTVDGQHILLAFQLMLLLRPYRSSTLSRPGQLRKGRIWKWRRSFSSRPYFCTCTYFCKHQHCVRTLSPSINTAVCQDLCAL